MSRSIEDRPERRARILRAQRGPESLTHIGNRAVMTKIVFNWKEGQIGSESNFPIVVHTWDKANELLTFWARSAPRSGSYDKTSYTVYFDDGESYKGRVDLKYEHAIQSTPLQDALLSFVAFYANACVVPDHLTEAQYQDCLSQVDPDDYLEFAESRIWGDLGLLATRARKDWKRENDYFVWRDTNTYSRA